MRATMWLAAMLLGLTGCQTPNEPVAQPTAAPVTTELTVQPATVLPTAFPRQLDSIAARDIVVPPSMLTVTEVSRPRAELRAGPGVQFELGDALLEQGTPIICFGRVGVWQRVLVPGTWHRGWVHHQALATPKPSSKFMTVPHKLLPTVLAVRPIASAMSYPQREAIKVEIPTGTMFRSLTQNGGRVLVWLQETNSVMWIAHKDVQ